MIHMVRHMVKRTPEGERIAASDEIFLLPEFFPGLTAERYRRGYRPMTRSTGSMRAKWAW